MLFALSIFYVFLLFQNSNMEKLFIKHRKKINLTNLTYVRNIIDNIVWKDRLIGIKGARGVGKTTLILQYIKRNFNFGEDNIYISLDDVYFSGNSLLDFAENFVQNKGKYLFLDEVHRYKNWAQELKNIYDDFPELKVVFTGSSILDIVKAKADLSRRAVIYKMSGLSFREYLLFNKNIEFEKYSLNDIIDKHADISDIVTAKIKPIPEFKEYLQSGYYPFFTEYSETYHSRLEQVINLVLEIDIPAMKHINNEGITKLKKLLYIISCSVPFKPNIKKLSEKTGISRNSLIYYLNYLEEANLLLLLQKDTHGVSALQKPEKIYFDNPNLIYTLSHQEANIGNVRETFFINQLSVNHKVTYSQKSDFLIDNKYTFEIGGKNKTTKQIKGIKNSFIAIDNIEYGYKNKIPLWIFGFLY